jgi:hypothetical protein
MKRTTLEKDGGSDPGAVVDGVFLDIENVSAFLRRGLITRSLGLCGAGIGRIVHKICHVAIP